MTGPQGALTDVRGRVIVSRLGIVALAVIGAYFASVDPFTFLFFAAYMAVGALLAVLRRGAER